MQLSHLISVKYGALVLLVLQNTLLVVAMRYSRVSEGPMYAASTAVFLMEAVKFACCNFVVLFQSGGVTKYISEMSKECTWLELAKLSVPAFLYTVQNNLLYFALSNLDATTYQVCYQSKILTTAVFSVLLLKKGLSRMQWLSLVILTIGVSITQISSTEHVNDNHNSEGHLFGFLAVLLAATLSGFSGVYFEKILKDSKTPLWIRNVQMGLTSCILALGGIYFSGDGMQVIEYGFFYGYNSVVFCVIFLQAVGGLIVAVVVKYADNILKGFAASFSIVTSFVLCVFIFDFKPTTGFLFGAALVNLSMFLYSLPNKSVREKSSKAQNI